MVRLDIVWFLVAGLLLFAAAVEGQHPRSTANFTGCGLPCTEECVGTCDICSLHKVCVASCNSPCNPSGMYFCDASCGECVMGTCQFAPPTRCNANCTGTEDCSTDTECSICSLAGRCVAPCGSKCTKSAHCDASCGTCVNGTCTYVPSTVAPPTARPSTTPQPSTAHPPTALPSTERPSTEHPSTAQPPPTARPSTAHPTPRVPSTLIPGTHVRTSSIPETSAPDTSIPSTHVPTSAIPATHEPTTSIPTSHVPTTLSPSTVAPTTATPTTRVPTTRVPTTVAPTTSAPPPVAAPVSVAVYFASGAGALCMLALAALAAVVYRRWSSGKRTADDMTSLMTNERFDSNTAQQTTTKYRVVQRIGKGAHGVVFLVEHKKTKVKFALKYICCEDDAELAMALKEFDVIRKVQGHPNMILMVDMFMNWFDQVEKPSRIGSNLAPRAKHLQQGTYGAVGFDPQGAFGGEEDEQPRYVCIVMEFYPLGDLKKFIVDYADDVIPEQVVLYVARQLCSLMAYLHGRQPPIVHRDIKPENVLMAEHHKVVVTDFGLAHNTEKTHMSTRAGTLHYSAPESWKRHYTAAVDVWGVGCIVYAMCSRRVRPGDARVMFSDAIDPHFAQELTDELTARGYSPRLVGIMLAMLSVDPKKRPTAADAHDLL